MKFNEAMATLQQIGTAQNVKIYKRHGAGDNLFGVSFANLTKLKKQIGVDQKLAEQLWQTGNTDAQTLALMVADPGEFTASKADVNHGETSCKTPDAESYIKKAAARQSKTTSQP